MAGASLTAVTVNANGLVALRAPSVTVNVTFVNPLALAAGVRVTVQFGAVPPTTMPAFASTAVLEEVPDSDPAQVRVLSISAILTAIALVAVSSAVVLAVTAEIVGASLTAITFSENVFVSVRVPSVTVNVTFVAPKALATGVRVIVQFGAVPEIAIPAFVSTEAFEAAR